MKNLKKLSRVELKKVKGGKKMTDAIVVCNISASWCSSGKAYSENWGTGSGTQLYCCG